MKHAVRPMIAVAAFAASGAAPHAAAAEEAAQGATDKKICRMIVPTGSIMAKRFCLTKAEWKDLNNQTEDSAGSALSRRGTGMCDLRCPNPGS